MYLYTANELYINLCPECKVTVQSHEGRTTRRSRQHSKHTGLLTPLSVIVPIEKLITVLVSRKMDKSIVEYYTGNKR